jgi:hypothetical protein
LIGAATVVVVVVVVVVIAEFGLQSVGVSGKVGAVLPHMASKGPGVPSEGFEQLGSCVVTLHIPIPRWISSFG